MNEKKYIQKNPHKKTLMQDLDLYKKNKKRINDLTGYINLQKQEEKKLRHKVQAHELNSCENPYLDPYSKTYYSIRSKLDEISATVSKKESELKELKAKNSIIKRNFRRFGTQIAALVLSATTIISTDNYIKNKHSIEALTASLENVQEDFTGKYDNLATKDTTDLSLSDFDSATITNLALDNLKLKIGKYFDIDPTGITISAKHIADEHGYNGKQIISICYENTEILSEVRNDNAELDDLNSRLPAKFYNTLISIVNAQKSEKKNDSLTAVKDVNNLEEKDFDTGIIKKAKNEYEMSHPKNVEPINDLSR